MTNDAAIEAYHALRARIDIMSSNPNQLNQLGSASNQLGSASNQLGSASNQLGSASNPLGSAMGHAVLIQAQAATQQGSLDPADRVGYHKRIMMSKVKVLEYIEAQMRMNLFQDEPLSKSYYESAMSAALQSVIEA
jgi:beta-lactamase class A